MPLQFPQSAHAQQALEFVSTLQKRFAANLEAATANHGENHFQRTDWLRDEGRHGGGWRLALALTPAFNRASINVSCVHYDDDPTRKLGSATAISTIIHPAHPLAPSVHMHISWTEMRDGNGYWRLMADLNPAIPNPDHTASFDQTLRATTGPLYDEGTKQGLKYFFIPSLNRHRGVSHFYLESFAQHGFEADLNFARTFGESVVDTYAAILADTLNQASPPTPEDLQAQRAYHTAYLLQVLTLDRGTTSGLLVHNQNDVGILGSLPSFIDRELLRSWVDLQPQPQDLLLKAIADALPPTGHEVNETHRAQLAQVVRQHYQTHPKALELQAAGDVVPPTVQNHQP